MNQQTKTNQTSVHTDFKYGIRAALERCVEKRPAALVAQRYGLSLSQLTAHVRKYRKGLYNSIFVQIAYAYNDVDDPKGLKRVMKDFNVSESVVHEANTRYQNGTLLIRHADWKPHWDNQDVVFHPDDSHLWHEHDNGALNKAMNFGFMDPDYDPINGGMHIDWSLSDIDALFDSVPDKVLEQADKSIETNMSVLEKSIDSFSEKSDTEQASIVRRAQTFDETLCETKKLMASPFFGLCCQHQGYEQAELIDGFNQIYDREVKSRLARLPL